MDDKASALRSLPAVDELLRLPEVQALAAEVSPALLAAWIREALGGIRRAAMEGRIEAGRVAEEAGRIPEILRGRAELLAAPVPRRVVNATGVVVHTNLGRAPLAPGAIAAMGEAAASYSNLEYDLGTGERGSRGVHLREAAAALFPGCGLLAVNNNAAAVMLVLNTLAEGREVVLSRGELVEIGGSFRIPEVMSKAGAILREVGTTNRTRIADYRAALSERTGLFVKVHTSNYRIVGFVEETPLAALAALAKETGIPVVVDQGSGSLLPERESGLGDEKSVGELLKDGADLVTFSGDKVLGGPQAGLIVGSPELVARCARNPLARALRIDKLRIGALAWTLAEHAAGRARTSLPVLEMHFRSPAEIERRARAVAAELERRGTPVGRAVEAGSSRVGGGAAPLWDVPSALLVLKPLARSVSSFEAALRRNDPPVVARISEGNLVLDLRTVDPAEDSLLAAALDAAARPKA